MEFSEENDRKMKFLQYHFDDISHKSRNNIITDATVLQKKKNLIDCI